MSTKVIEDARLKAVEAVVGEHELEFYALAFSKMPDKQGDRIHPRALDGWLERFYAAGKPLPVSFHHSAVRGESAGDPFSVIGYAPADPDHVWVDAYGLRIRAILETEINDKAEQVYRLAKRGILTGASAVFASDVTAEKRQKDGSVLITSIPEVREAGPTLAPANTDAYVLAVKALEEEIAEGDLEAHQPAERAAAEEVLVAIPITDELRAKAGRVISAATAARLKAARELLDELLGLVVVDPEQPPIEEAKSESPNDWVRDKLAQFE